jgi:hypothetical protein
MKSMKAKTISFIAMMGVLGNVLFAISYYTGNIAPGIALDFSLVAAYIAGLYGGPLIGLISGIFVGGLPGIMFGPMGMSSWLGLIGLPLGKGLTGLTAGIFARNLGLGRKQHSSILAFPIVFLSYIPECLFTYAFFAYLMPCFIGSGSSLTFYSILPKALVEITVISFLMAALIGNHGFNGFVSKFFAKPYILPRIKTSKSR